MSSKFDADTLHMYITNDRDLHIQQESPIIKNLVTKVARDQYNHEKAIKLWMYLTETGAKKFAKEKDSSLPWNKIFPVSVRREAAIIFADNFRDEFNLGNYDGYLPKKYQGKKYKIKESVNSIVNNIVNGYVSLNEAVNDILFEVKKKSQVDREPDGKYTLKNEHMCLCGHNLGNHLAVGRLKDRECTVEDCDCSGFQRAK